MPELNRLHAIVFGKVQGVFYRAFCRENARQLSLNGYCKNLSSGSVEVLVEGKKENLLKFLEKLNQGPPAASVEKIETSWLKASGEFKEFEVKY